MLKLFISKQIYFLSFLFICDFVFRTTSSSTSEYFSYKIGSIRLDYILVPLKRWYIMFFDSGRLPIRSIVVVAIFYILLTNKSFNFSHNIPLKIVSFLSGYLLFKDFCENVSEEPVPHLKFYEEVSNSNTILLRKAFKFWIVSVNLCG